MLGRTQRGATSTPAASTPARGPADRGPGIDVVRIGYSDLIGIERGRDVLVNRFARTVGDGVAFCRSVYGTTPMGDVVDIQGGLEAGLPDIAGLPRPRPPCSRCRGSRGSRTASPTCSTRTAARRRRARGMSCSRVVEQFAELGLQPIVGPGAGVLRAGAHRQERRPAGSGTARRPATSTSSGCKGDPENVLLRTLRQLSAYGLEVVAANHEFCRRPVRDQPLALRRARRGRPGVPVQGRGPGARPPARASWRRSWPSRSTTRAASGFHLHFSTSDDDGTPLFDDPTAEDGLSDVGRSAIAGVLAHAPALAALCNPTINSYKRFGPDTLAPWLIDWGLDNRSAMIRIPPERGRASRMELRLGDASGQPLPGHRRPAGRRATSASATSSKPPAAAGGLRLRPEQGRAGCRGDLATALDALEADTELGDMLGEPFVAIVPAPTSAHELERFSHWVTDWEFREYAYHL